MSRRRCGSRMMKRASLRNRSKMCTSQDMKHPAAPLGMKAFEAAESKFRRSSSIKPLKLDLEFQGLRYENDNATTNAISIFPKRNLHKLKDNRYLYSELDTRLMEITILQIENPSIYILDQSHSWKRWSVLLLWILIRNNKITPF